MQEVLVRSQEMQSLEEVLLENGYYVEKRDDVYTVNLKEFTDLYVLLAIEGKTLFIQLNIVSVNELKDDVGLYKRLLDLNTEILPVSIAIDSTNQEDPRIVINESLAIESLDENELLKTFEVIEMNIERIYNILKEYKK